jgi:hypothetical protein
MTYKQWMTATGARFQLTEADVDLILTNRADLIPNPAATVDVRTAKTALCKEFASLIPLANVSEGGYSITWNWDALKLWYSQTCAELGLQDITKPQIRNKSFVW